MECLDDCDGEGGGANGNRYRLEPRIPIAQGYTKGDQPMLVMDCMADILRREGIDTMFCFPTTPIIEAAVAAGIV